MKTNIPNIRRVARWLAAACCALGVSGAHGQGDQDPTFTNAFNPKIGAHQRGDADLDVTLYQKGEDGNGCQLKPVSGSGSGGGNEQYEAGFDENGAITFSIKFKLKVSKYPDLPNSSDDEDKKAAVDDVYNNNRVKVTISAGLASVSPSSPIESSSFTKRDGEFQREVEVTISPGSSTSLSDETLTVTVEGKGTDNGDPDSWVTIGKVDIVPACAECSTCNGQTNASTGNSLVLEVGVAGGRNGHSSGKFWLHGEAASEKLYRREALQFRTGLGMKTVRDAQGALRQVLTATTFVDLVDLEGDAGGYEMRFYNAGEVWALGAGGVFESPAGAPIKTVRVSNPDASGENIEQVLVVENPGQGGQLQHLFAYTVADKKWALVQGGLRKESKSRVESGAFATVDQRVLHPDDTPVSFSRETWQTYSFGSVMTEQIFNPGPNQEKTVWQYYDNAGPASPAQAGAGAVKMEIGPDGRWSHYEYTNERRLARVVAGVGNAAPNASGQREKTYTYGGGASQESETESIAGVVVGRRWLLVDGLVTRSVRATDPAAGPAAPGNLVTTTTRYGPEGGQFAGFTQSVLSEQGILTTYAYVQEGTERVTITRTGAPDAGQTGVIDGIETMKRVNQWGVAIEGSEKDNASGVTLSFWIATSVDEMGRVTSAGYSDGTTESWAYDCCHLESHTDRQGITTSYGYDALGRQTSTTRLGITERLTFDPAGLTTKRERIGNDGSVMVLEENVYDLAGRVLSRTDAAGEITTYAYSQPSGGGSVTTTTYPDGGTQFETTFADGRVSEIGGTAAAPMKYRYGAWAGGEWTQEIRLDGNGGETEWVKTYANATGQTVKTEYPDGAIAENFYNNKGQLVRNVDPDGVTTLYAYNAEGEQIQQAVDMNGNGAIDLDGPDRVQQSERTVLSDGSQQSASKIYAAENSAAATIVSLSTRSADGRSGSQTNFNQSSSQSTTLAGSGNWTTTSTGIAGEQTTDRYIGGRLASRTWKDNTGAVIGSKTYTYDARGRLASETDSRTGVVSYTYNTSDQVLTITQPAPDGNPAPMVTSHGYDSMGRQTSVTLPDGSVTTTTYDLRGQAISTSGSQTYAVNYTFDAQGRMKTMTTTGQSGPAVTTWIYDGARGWLSRKQYADGNGTDYNYTPGGRLATRTWARNDAASNPLATTYSYNAAGDLILTDYSDATADVTITNTRFGAPQSITDATGIRTFAYNAQLQQVSETLDATFYKGRILTRQYDGLDRPAGLKLGTAADPDADHAFSYGYDSAARVASVMRGSDTFTYSYVPQSTSNLVAGVTGPIHSVTNTWEPTRDMLDVKANATGTTLHSRFDYAVNRLGQRTGVATSGAAFASGFDWAWGYNPTGELISADHSLTTAFNRGYQYDGIGNRERAAAGSIDPADPGATTYTANTINQYTEIATATPVHDADGNLLSDGASQNLGWNGENRFVELRDDSNNVVATYLYDYQGRRVRKTTIASAPQGATDTVYVYDGWNLIAEYEVLPSSLSLHTSIVWGLDLSGSPEGAGGVGGLLSLTNASGTYYPAYDGNGNISEYLSSLGTVAAHYEYDPFGNTVVATGASANDFNYRFSTKSQDEETGFYYYGYRYFNPEAGRWVNRDPLGEAGGSNLLAFVNNDPVGAIDLLGLFEEYYPYQSPGGGRCRGPIMGPNLFCTDGWSYMDYWDTWYGPPNGGSRVSIKGLGTPFGGAPTCKKASNAKSPGWLRNTRRAGMRFLKEISGYNAGERFWEANMAGDTAALGRATVDIARVYVKPAQALNISNKISAINRTSHLWPSLANMGRWGKQARLRELGADPKVSASDRGWIQQEMNSIERGQRTNIRVPPGRNLAHRRGFEAKKGHSYEHSDLQGINLHKLQHKHEGY